MKRVIVSPFLFFIISLHFCFAGVDFVDNETENNNKPLLNERKKIIRPSSKQVELTGYVDSVAVNLVVNIENNRYVTGNMMIRGGQPIYLSGELVNGVFYLYDNKGKRYTLNLDSHR